MTSKSDAVREILAEMPDAQASDIADAVADRFGVSVSAAYVRVVKSRGAVSSDGRIPPRIRTMPRDEPATEPRIPRAPKPPRSTPRVHAPVKTATPHDDRYSGGYSSDDLGDDLSDEELYAWIDKVEAAVRQAVSGQPQAVTDTPEIIQMISEICDDPELRANNQPFAYEILTATDGTQTLRLYADVPVPAPKPRGNRRGKQREPGCEWCGNRQAISGVNLYLVHGGALGNRQRILCQMHATPEAAAGATVTPYQVYSDLYGPVVIRPAKTPMQEWRERVMQSAGTIVGYKVAPDYDQFGRELPS
jgi:hypothetical protein